MNIVKLLNDDDTEKMKSELKSYPMFCSLATELDTIVKGTCTLYMHIDHTLHSARWSLRPMTMKNFKRFTGKFFYAVYAVPASVKHTELLRGADADNTWRDSTGQPLNWLGDVGSDGQVICGETLDVLITHLSSKFL